MFIRVSKNTYYFYPIPKYGIHFLSSREDCFDRPWFVCWFVSLAVSKITQKSYGRILMKFQEMQ